MNRDLEAFQRQLLKLVQDLIPPSASAEAAEAHPPLGQEGSGQPTLDAPQALTSQGVNLPTSNPHGAVIPSHQGDSLLELGDIPAVQERFQALLKHRLQSEIQKNPPLFPWESEIHDYESSRPMTNAIGAERSPDAIATGLGAKTPALMWLRQLDQLELPIQVPQSVLAQLLTQCQDVVRSSLREGAKLVRAVEDLFPGQADSLNYLAGLVITSPARSGSRGPITSPNANFPGSYETAVPAQQMVLSLLAAREILSTLTLTVSATQSVVDRQWLTELGTLNLHVEYETSAATPSVRIQSTLPCGGSLTLQDNEQQSIARRPNAGNLSVELFGLQPDQFYVLDVQLNELEQTTLTFVIQAIAA
ncbi:hypothetical protein ACN4EK_17005 [Pantanalinema rosaneae CENA516]|uniref:hypothetical protein n=1 Tax=Pantanalinema rosaneae TaxID=1620701 RepID=UPI003D6F6B55